MKYKKVYNSKSFFRPVVSHLLGLYEVFYKPSHSYVNMINSGFYHHFRQEGRDILFNICDDCYDIKNFGYGLDSENYIYTLIGNNPINNGVASKEDIENVQNIFAVLNKDELNSYGEVHKDPYFRRFKWSLKTVKLNDRNRF